MTKRKAEQRLTNFDFSEEGAHIALVHKDQGGSANGYNTLITKATKKYSDEFVQKASKVQVTLSFEEFLRKFFDLWYEDARILATMLGMQDEEENDDWYQDYIIEQVDKFEILKSANESENKTDFLASLSEDDYLTILKNQELIEKAFAKNDQSHGGVKKPTNTKKATTAVTKEETPMSDNNPETITKAQYDEIQKAMDKQTVELQKAKEAIELYKAKEKEVISKARKDSLLDAVEVEATAETLFKAVGELEQEAFDNVVAVLKALNTKDDDSAMFIEKGASNKEDNEQTDAVAKAFHAKYANQ